MPNVKLFWREGVWPPASCEAHTTKEVNKDEKCSCIRVFFFFFNIKLTQEPITGFNKLSCPQIWNIEKEKDREKEKVGRQASEAQREKEQKKHFLLEEQYEIL